MSSPVGGWFGLAAVIASGASLKWLRDVVRPGFSYAAVTNLADSPRRGTNGARFVPRVMDERPLLWDNSGRGTLAGLSLASSPGGVDRAVLEGTALALRHKLTIAPRLACGPPSFAIRARRRGASCDVRSRRRHREPSRAGEEPDAKAPYEATFGKYLELVDVLGAIQHRAAAHERMETQDER